MRPPFFQQDAPSYVNYGGIGYLIGHEIGHSMGKYGQEVDENNTITRWWTVNDTSLFKEKSQCFIDQYSQFRVERLNLTMNGTKIVEETVCDNLGISQAYKAYQKYQSENPDELPLPELNLNKEQLFFLATAQAWCEKRTDYWTEYNVKHSSHPIGMARTMGMMQNSAAFSKAFNCEAGDAMNPATKCKIF